MSLQTATLTGETCAPAAAAKVATSLREFLAFKLGAEEYGIDILRVQEIPSSARRWSTSTCWPSTRSARTC